MKGRRNEGFTLLETLIAIVVLGLVVVPACSGMIVSFRMNAKADRLLQDQLAVSSAVETLMAEGITDPDKDYAADERFQDVTITTVNKGNYYDVTVTSKIEEVEVKTQIRAGGGT